MRIAQFGRNVFLVISGSPLTSIRELVDARDGLRPPGNVALLARGDYTYAFSASLYEAEAEPGFEEFLGSLQFRE